MNSKQIGNQFEKAFLKYLSDNGWWAHFMIPNRAGSQPFDVIAIRNDKVYAIDCKTCATDRFAINRIESNQHFAFMELVWKTQAQCGLIVLHDDEMYYVPFELILEAEQKGEKSIKLTEEMKEDACDRFERN